MSVTYKISFAQNIYVQKQASTRPKKKRGRTFLDKRIGKLKNMSLKFVAIWCALLFMCVSCASACQNFGTRHTNGTHECQCPLEIFSGDSCDYFSCPELTSDAQRWPIYKVSPCACSNTTLWTGFSCSLCELDESCEITGSAHSRSYYCDKSYKINRKKQFECLVTDPLTSDIVGHLATIQCARENRTTDSNKTTTYGALGSSSLSCFLQFWYNNTDSQSRHERFEEMIACSMQDCTLSESTGSSESVLSTIRYTCKQTNCTCTDSASHCTNFIRGVISGMRGSAYIECDRSLRSCVLHHDNLEADIEMSCRGSECVKNGTEFEQEQESGFFLGSLSLSSALILLISVQCTLMLLIILLYLVSVCYFRMREAVLYKEYKAAREGLIRYSTLKCNNLAFVSRISKWKTSKDCSQACMFVSRFVLHYMLVGAMKIARVPLVLCKKCSLCCECVCGLCLRRGRRRRRSSSSRTRSHDSQTHQMLVGVSAGREMRSRYEQGTEENEQDDPMYQEEEEEEEGSLWVNRDKDGGIAWDTNERVKSMTLDSKHNDGYWYQYDVRLSCTSLEFENGKVTAIMGLSGCGKTTLIDLLAGRSKDGMVLGSVTYGDKPYASQFRRFVAYVYQDDNGLNPYATVREEIRHALDMKSFIYMSEQEKKDKVETIIKIFGLSDIASSMIGYVDEKKTSGGERRRISIAKEAVWSPPVLLLDEPTSGLDSATSSRIMTYIKAYSVKTGSTVILSVHSPSEWAFFTCIDDLLLFHKSHLVYKGHPSSIVPDMAQEECGISYNKSMGTVPDFVMSVLEKMDSETPLFIKNAITKTVTTCERPRLGPDMLGHVTLDEWQAICKSFDVDSTISGLAMSQDAREGFSDSAMVSIELAREKDHNLHWSQIFRKVLPAEVAPAAANKSQVAITPPTYSPLTEAAAAALATDSADSTSVSNKKNGRDAAKPINLVELLTFYCNPFRHHKYLFARLFKNFYKSPSALLFNIVAPLVAGLFIGSLAFRPGIDNEANHTKLGAMFWMCIVLALSSSISIGKFNEERSIYLREHSNGYYSAQSYYLCTVLFDMIFLKTMSALLLTLPAYLMIGLRGTLLHYAYHLVVMVMFNIVCGLTCVIISTLIFNETIANAASSVLFMFGSLFAGSMINRTKLHFIVRLIFFVSHWSYTYELLVVNEFYRSKVILNIKGVDIPGLGDYWINFLGMDSFFPEWKLIALFYLCLFHVIIGLFLFTHLVKEQR